MNIADKKYRFVTVHQPALMLYLYRLVLHKRRLFVIFKEILMKCFHRKLKCFS